MRYGMTRPFFHKACLFVFSQSLEQIELLWRLSILQSTLDFEKISSRIAQFPGSSARQLGGMGLRLE
jgi:hypothetical protein